MPRDLWLIQPFNSLVVADGRPFENQPGSRAKSLSFPPPSVTAGGFRARAGVKAHYNFSSRLSDNEYADLLAMQVYGPLLLKETQQGFMPFLAAPADALIRQTENTTTCHRLQPLDSARFPPQQTDLQPSFHLVGSINRPNGKAPAILPRFWSWQNRYLDWLRAPKPHDVDLNEALKSHQMYSLEQDTRTHVGIMPESQSAEEGRLFQTQGLSFQSLEAGYGLGLWSSTPIDPAVASLGAERRLVEWYRVPSGTAAGIETSDSSIIAAITQTKHCRIMLLTPAIWDAGFYPSTLPTFGLPITATIKAVVNPRPEYVSGWDLRLQRPKPTRRLAAAGTVLFVELAGSDAEIEQWANQLWFSNISSSEQANKDGFGLAVLGTWNDGYLQELA